ncbi:hypothetical protein J3F83DRAFT_740695 [Trichoderma novae-zelandiae]
MTLFMTSRTASPTDKPIRPHTPPATLFFFFFKSISYFHGFFIDRLSPLFRLLPGPPSGPPNLEASAPAPPPSPSPSPSQQATRPRAEPFQGLETTLARSPASPRDRTQTADQTQNHTGCTCCCTPCLYVDRPSSCCCCSAQRSGRGARTGGRGNKKINTMSINWVMLNQSGFVKLGNERVLWKLDGRISCELSVPSELRARCVPFHRKSDKGALFLTNKRVIYLPAKPTQEPKFESFSAPILKFQDSTTSSSMWWGWVWKSDCIPVSGGGVPPELPRIEVKFTFSDGGMIEFNEAYIGLRERLFQYQEMRRELDASTEVPDEPLPAYEAQGGRQEPPAPSQLAVPGPNRSDSSSSRRAPNEPPPNYDEAQAQQLSNRLEDHIRNEVDRGAADEQAQ